MLRLSEGLLQETLRILRTCGEGRNECVVYWIGDLASLDTVDGVMHPVHLSSPCHYEIDPSWHNRAWLDLAHEARAIRAQVHTHPGKAYHSATDDRYPITPEAGLLSLVIPNLAERGDLRGAHLCELDEHGSWRKRGIDQTLVIV